MRVPGIFMAGDRVDVYLMVSASSTITTSNNNNDKNTKESESSSSDTCTRVEEQLWQRLPLKVVGEGADAWLAGATGVAMFEHVSYKGSEGCAYSFKLNRSGVEFTSARDTALRWTFGQKNGVKQENAVPVEKLQERWMGGFVDELKRFASSSEGSDFQWSRGEGHN